MSKIILGKSNNKNVELDLDLLLRGRMLIQANSGKGKSWLLRRLGEQLFGKIQVIIIDPEGEFPTLREKFGYVLVGKGGETPADPRSAALVAHKLLELRASAVCDLYEMKPTSARHEWVRRFLEAMIDAPKNLWHPCIIALDEAHTFCPEKGSGESEASEAVIGMGTRGRKRGFCIIPATQRLGKLRKDLAAELLNVMIGGTFIDIDRKRAADALGIYGAEQHKFFDEIKVLPRGDFFCLGPAISNERILLTVGPVETTHPEAGSAKHAAEPPPAPEKIKALLPKLADLPKAAEEKARTEAELRVELRSLKAQLRSQPIKVETRAVQVADPRAIERAVKQAAVAWQKAIDERDAIIRKFKGHAGVLMDQAMKLASDMNCAPRPRPKIEMPKVLASPPPPPVPPRKFPMASHLALVGARHEEGVSIDLDEVANGRLPSSERTVLRAIAQYEGGVERNHLSILTGYKRSTRDAYVARLRAKSMVADRGGKIVPTEKGLAALGTEFEPLPQGEELQRYWLARLPKGEKEIFEILLAAAGELITRETLTEQTGYKRSTRDAYLARMAAKKIVESVGRGEVKAAPLLFE